MNSDAEAMLASILAELAASAETQRKVEEKAVFRLLNYCPRESSPLIEKPMAPK